MSRTRINLSAAQRINRAQRWAVSHGFHAIEADLAAGRIARAASRTHRAGYHNVTADLLRALAETER